MKMPRQKCAKTLHSDKFSVKVGIHQDSVLSPLLFAIVMDVVTEGVKEGLLEEILYADGGNN